MEESVVYPGQNPALGLSAWKTIASWAGAIIIAILFLVSGIWKIVDPLEAATKLHQMKVPGIVAQPFTIGLGVVEAWSAVLILIPRFRRWGAWITGLMLVAFMIWVGYYYTDLTGQDCSCFPWLKRAVGPGFFIGDTAMLLASVAAGIWSRKSTNIRGAVIILGAISVFAGVSYGVVSTQQSGVMAPETTMVDGKPFPLHEGKVFLYFFDPECTHCYQAAVALSKHKWQDTRLVAIPTRMPQFAQGFLDMTGFKAVISSDAEILKERFPHGDPPFGVALENGRQKAAAAIFDGNQPENTLRELGFIE